MTQIRDYFIATAAWLDEWIEVATPFVLVLGILIGVSWLLIRPQKIREAMSRQTGGSGYSKVMLVVLGFLALKHYLGLALAIILIPAIVIVLFIVDRVT